MLVFMTGIFTSFHETMTKNRIEFFSLGTWWVLASQLSEIFFGMKKKIRERALCGNTLDFNVKRSKLSLIYSAKQSRKLRAVLVLEQIVH